MADSEIEQLRAEIRNLQSKFQATEQLLVRQEANHFAYEIMFSAILQLLSRTGQANLILTELIRTSVALHVTDNNLSKETRARLVSALESVLPQALHDALQPIPSKPH
ncbi:hypothetical protein [Burkholderia ambifaria]|uniref:hypothetical protein n=1 Tax=Burkholderia ambifaria TaxID=152480 RepID=UPI00158B24EF|nr:hypothetical protein [Burkholderia ambifaria]